jgi:hypothetical protein
MDNKGGNGIMHEERTRHMWEAEKGEKGMRKMNKHRK